MDDTQLILIFALIVVGIFWLAAILQRRARHVGPLFMGRRTRATRALAFVISVPLLTASLVAIRVGVWWWLFLFGIPTIALLSYSIGRNERWLRVLQQPAALFRKP